MNDPQSPGEQAYELSVGDVLQVGDLTVTVVEINESDVSFRIDSPDHHEECDALPASSFAQEALALPPRQGEQAGLQSAGCCMRAASTCTCGRSGGDFATR